MAVVRLNGQDFYLGNHGTPESHEKYRRDIAEWLSSPQMAQASTFRSPDRSQASIVNELVLSFLNYARSYYVNNDRPTSEFTNIKDALRRLVKLYVVSSATEFGPHEHADFLIEPVSLAGVAPLGVEGRVGGAGVQSMRVTIHAGSAARQAARNWPRCRVVMGESVIVSNWRRYVGAVVPCEATGSTQSARALGGAELSGDQPAVRLLIFRRSGRTKFPMITTQTSPPASW